MVYKCGTHQTKQGEDNGFFPLERNNYDVELFSSITHSNMSTIRSIQERLIPNDNVL